MVVFMSLTVVRGKKVWIQIGVEVLSFPGHLKLNLSDFMRV